MSTIRTSFILEHILSKLWKIASPTYHKRYHNNWNIEIGYAYNKWKCWKELFVTTFNITGKTEKEKKWKKNEVKLYYQ